MIDYTTSGLLKSPPISRLDKEQTKELLSRWHYLGNVKGVVVAYGHDEGCLVFTNCRSRVYEQKFLEKGIRVIELARMVGVDGHKWSMSSLTSLALRQLNKDYSYDLVVTYSDPFAGHNGMTYRASGWKDDGVIMPDGHPLIFIDEKQVSPRSLYDKHGTQSIPRMKEIYGDRITTKEKPLKHRFIKILNKQTEKRLHGVY